MIDHHLKIMVLNAENLFIFVEKMKSNQKLENLDERSWQGVSSSLFDNKPLRKVQELALQIKELDPDVILLSEIGGESSLFNFQYYFLDNQYMALTMPSNSDRGIDLGYLVKVNTFSSHDLFSHRDFTLEDNSYFSRDLLELRLTLSQNLSITFFLTHLKSKLNLKGNDFEGRAQRGREIKGIVDIIRKVNPQYYILAGDMNGIAYQKEYEEEFAPFIKDLQLQDVTEKSNMSPEERFSYIHFKKSGERFFQQLDYAFLSPTLDQYLIKSSVCFPRYLTHQKTVYPIPQTHEQKKILPSDHYPLWFELRINE